MSKTAFKTAGEPFEIPRDARTWRVRRISGRRGAPEVLYSNKPPLVLPVHDVIDLVTGNHQ